MRKIRNRLILMLVCIGIMVYHLIVSLEILYHPYMIGMFLILGTIILYQAIAISFKLLKLKNK